MKKIIIGMALAASVAAGCKSIPTDSQMYNTSYAVGASAGLIADMTKIDAESRVEVIEIVKVADTCVPATNETFAEAWTPIATNHIHRLIVEGKITEAQGVLIAKTFNLACDGIDYYFNVRYPSARQYQELVEAATHGFCDGFLVTFKAPEGSFSASSRIQVDQDAYKFLASKYLK